MCIRDSVIFDSCLCVFFMPLFPSFSATYTMLWHTLLHRGRTGKGNSRYAGMAPLHTRCTVPMISTIPNRHNGMLEAIPRPRLGGPIPVSLPVFPPAPPYIRCRRQGATAKRGIPVAARTDGMGSFQLVLKLGENGSETCTCLVYTSPSPRDRG